MSVDDTSFSLIGIVRGDVRLARRDELKNEMKNKAQDKMMNETKNEIQNGHSFL